jgi:hypothetical protein
VLYCSLCCGCGCRRQTVIWERALQLRQMATSQLAQATCFCSSWGTTYWQTASVQGVLCMQYVRISIGIYHCRCDQVAGSRCVQHSDTSDLRRGFNARMMQLVLCLHRSSYKGQLTSHLDIPRSPLLAGYATTQSKSCASGALWHHMCTSAHVWIRGKNNAVFWKLPACSEGGGDLECRNVLTRKRLLC